MRYSSLTDYNGLQVTTPNPVDRGGNAINTNFKIVADWRQQELGLLAQNPPGMARMVSVKASGTISILVQTTTGYAAVRWWNGSVVVGGTGSPSSNITLSNPVPTSGNWKLSAPKEIFIWSCTSGNATQSGDLTYIACNDLALTALDVRGLAELTYLNCNANELISLDVGGLTALTDLNCYSNKLAMLDVSDSTKLMILYCAENNLTSLNTRNLTALTYLFCDSNNLTSLDVGGLTTLIELTCNANNLATLDVSELTSLNNLQCNSNNLISLRASSVVLSYGLSTHGSDVSNNLLSASALNQFYTDLGADVGATGIIDVSDNFGTAGDDPSIATAKGYTIIGS